MIHISPVYARYVLQEYQRRGYDPGELFAGTGLSVSALQSSDTIALEDFNQLLENGRKALDDELGLIIGRQVNVMTLGSVGVAAASAPTLRDGLQALENFSQLHAGQIQVEVRSTLQGVASRMHFVSGMGSVERFHAESGALLLQSYVEMIGGRPLVDAEFRMPFERPAYAARYEQLFHGPISFGWPITSVEIPRHWLDTPSPYFHAELWQQSQVNLESRLRELGSQTGDSYSAYVRSCLRASELPLPDLAAIAARINVSTRTLNRRLLEENANFRQLRNGVLQEWAERYLSESGASIEAIAAILGYGDVSNFRRAFKAWTGESPGSFRKRQANG